MTHKEAIRDLNTIKDYFEQESGAYPVSLKYAIGVLKNDAERVIGYDLINREDAIWWVKAACNPYGKPTLDFESGKKVIEHLKHMPSADRPQGEWVKHDDERDYCSRCKHIFKTRTITQQDKWTLYIDDLGYNYCPNCGARMKGADCE